MTRTALIDTAIDILLRADGKPGGPALLIIALRDRTGALTHQCATALREADRQLQQMTA